MSTPIEIQHHRTDYVLVLNRGETTDSPGWMDHGMIYNLVKKAFLILEDDAYCGEFKQKLTKIGCRVVTRDEMRPFLDTVEGILCYGEAVKLSSREREALARSISNPFYT